MTTRMPAAWHSGDGRGHGRAAAGRPGPPGPRNSSVEVVLARRAACPGRVPAPGHAQHAQALRTPAPPPAATAPRARAGGEVAQVGDGLGGALGGDHHGVVDRPVSPGVGHGQQLRARAGTRAPASSRGAGARCRQTSRSPSRVQGLLHRVERVPLAGQDGRTRAGRGAARAGPAPAGPTSAAMPARRERCCSVMWFCVSVPVLSTHSTVAAPSVSMAGMRRVSTLLREMRQAPRARKIVSTTGNSSGQRGHGHGDAGQQALLPDRPRRRRGSGRRRPPPRRRRRARRGRRCGPAGRSPSAGASAPARPGCRALPILPSSVRRPVARTSATPWPAVTSVPEKSEGRSSPPGRSRAGRAGRGQLAHGHGLAGQQRLVGGQVDALRAGARRPARGRPRPGPPGRRATTSRPAMRRRCAVADHQRPRARQVAQRLQRPLGAPLLDDGDAHDDEDEAEQHQGVRRLAHGQVERARSDQHEEHRLADHLQGDGQEPPRSSASGARWGLPAPAAAGLPPRRGRPGRPGPGRRRGRAGAPKVAALPWPGRSRSIPLVGRRHDSI